MAPVVHNHVPWDQGVRYKGHGKPSSMWGEGLVSEELTSVAASPRPT